MAQFSLHTTFRPDIGVDEIPISFRGQVVSQGVLLKEGIFAYELTDPELIALIESLKARMKVDETDGHFHAEISESNGEPLD